MTKILDRLPPLPQSTDVPFEGRHVRVRRGQLLVWASIGLRGERRTELLSPAFPVLFDTGNNYDFYLHEHHLVNWAGIRPSLLMVLGRRTVNEQVDIPCLAADVWLYPNEPGTYQRAAGKPPFLLDIEQGIAVRPAQSDTLSDVEPRLPLLGLAAARKNQLDFWYDSAADRFHLRGADWRSMIIRLLQKL